MNDDFQLKQKHPESCNLQGADIISKAETTDNENDNQDFSQKQALIGAFSELMGRGFNVIPIIYGDKKPAIKWTQYQTKQTTLEQSKAWDSGRFNVGIITGAIQIYLCLMLMVKQVQ